MLYNTVFIFRHHFVGSMKSESQQVSVVYTQYTTDVVFLMSVELF